MSDTQLAKFHNRQWQAQTLFQGLPSPWLSRTTGNYDHHMALLYNNQKFLDCLQKNPYIYVHTQQTVSMHYTAQLIVNQHKCSTFVLSLTEHNQTLQQDSLVWKLRMKSFMFPQLRCAKQGWVFMHCSMSSLPGNARFTAKYLAKELRTASLSSLVHGLRVLHFLDLFAGITAT